MDTFEEHFAEGEARGLSEEEIIQELGEISEVLSDIQMLKHSHMVPAEMENCRIGQLRTESVSGDVEYHDCLSRQLLMKSTSGDLSADSLTGDAELRTMSGTRAASPMWTHLPCPAT